MVAPDKSGVELSDPGLVATIGHVVDLLKATLLVDVMYHLVTTDSMLRLSGLEQKFSTC